MARSKKKKRVPKPYTLRWFLQLVPYSYRLNDWGMVKGFHYLILCYARARFLWFPTRGKSLDTKYRKKYGVGYREYYYQKWLIYPLPIFSHYGGRGVMFTLAAYTVLLGWLLDMFLYAMLGFRVTQEIDHLFLGGNVIVVCIIVIIIHLYASWGDQEDAYAKDFERRFSARQKFFTWLFFSFPVVGSALFLILFGILIMLFK